MSSKIEAKIKKLIEDIKDPVMALSVLEEAADSPEDEIANFANTLLDMYEFTGPDKFPDLIKEVVNQYEATIMGKKDIPPITVVPLKKADDEMKKSKPREISDFDQELSNTIEAVCAIYQYSLPIKTFGYGVNPEDYRVTFTFSRSHTYGLTIYPKNDPKKVIIRQTGNSPSELIDNCDKFMKNMLVLLNKNKIVKASN